MAKTLVQMSPAIGSASGLGSLRDIGVVSGLNIAADAVLAFSMRLVRQAYAGPLVQLRNSETAALADVAPSSLNEMVEDTSVVTIRAAGSSGYALGQTMPLSTFQGNAGLTVSIVYNQGISGGNMTAGDAGAYPLAGAFGAMNPLIGGNPPILFNGTSQYLELAQARSGVRTILLAGRAPAAHIGDGTAIFLEGRGTGAAYRVVTTSPSGAYINNGTVLPVPGGGNQLPNLTGQDIAVAAIFNDPNSQFRVDDNAVRNGPAGPFTGTHSVFGRDGSNTYYYDLALTAYIEFNTLPATIDDLYDSFREAFVE